MKKLILILSLLPVVFLMSVATLVPETCVAQVAPGGLVNCNGTNCSACNLVEMVNRGITILFGAVGIIFAIIMMKAGFGLVTSGGNPGALNEAKSMFQNAIIGLLIVMSAWLVVDIIMRSLLTGGEGNLGATFTGWGPWSEVRCQVQTATQEWSRTGRDVVDPGAVTPPAATVPAGTLTHAQAVSALGGQFTVTSSGNCSDRTNRSCTSLDGIRELTIQRVRELQSAVGVPLIVTGGTEAGHAAGTYSHANGYKIDLRIDPALNNYITSNFTSLGGSRWRDGNGNVYYRHGPPDHWDILVTN